MPISLVELLRSATDKSMEISDQLKIAHKLTVALLQFQSTPWLSPCRDQARELSAQNLADPETYSKLTTTAAEAEAAPDHLLYGINNMELCSLGIALSAIGHRRPLQDLKLENEPNDIITARRLSIHLGRRYQEIIRKCLWCDFSAGFGLETTKLQSAVYSEVVVALEGMMRSLTI